MTPRTLTIIGHLLFLAASARAQVPPPIIPQPCGVNIHFVDPNPADVDAIAAIGYRFARMDFGWGGIERTAGQYDFSGYDKLVDALAAKQIRLLFILDYSNRLYDNGLSPHTPDGRAAFAKYAAAAAKHYAGKPIIWEIWNEPNISFWKPKPNAIDYADLCAETIKAVRAADPKAYIVGPASSTFPWDFFQVLADRGVLAQFDAISVHPYRQTAPETAASDYHRLRVLLDRASPNKRLPIISGEWGYSTGWKNLTEQTQSQYLPRQWLSNLVNDVNLSIWYDWKDDGADPKEPEHHFGSVYRDLKLKPAAQAAQTLTTTLANYRYVRRISLPDPKDFILVFQNEAKLALAAWTTADPHIIQLALPPGQSDIVDLTGQKRQATATVEGMPLRIGPAVQYILPQGNDRQLALLGCWGTPISTLGISTAKAAAVTVNIANPTKEPLRGQLLLEIDGKISAQQAINLPPAAPTQNISLPVALTGYSRQSLDGIVRLSVEGAPAQPLQQSPVTLLVTNAVSAAVLPPVGGDVLVLIDNPSAQALRGDIRVVCGPQSGVASFDIPSGKKEASARVHLLSIAPDTAIEVTGTTSGGLPLFPGQLVLWKSIPLAAANDTPKATVEGDAKVAAQASVKLVKLTPPLPQPGLKDGLAVDYRFAAGWRYAVIAPPPSSATLDGKPHRLGMWVRGDASGNTLRCRIRDVTGQTFQPTLGKIDWTDWRWVAMPIDGKDAYFFGGANDGSIHYPIKIYALALIDSDRSAIDRDLQIQIAGPAIEY